MIKLISSILFIVILCGDYFAQPKLFGNKISGNGDIISDIFLIQDGFVLDSAKNNSRTYRFEYNNEGTLIRDINFLTFQVFDSSTGRMRVVPGYRDYFYNERGDVDSVEAGIWKGTQGTDSVVSGSTISYVYDNEGNILSKINSSNGTLFVIEENSYDSSGNLILNKIVKTLANDTTYTTREYDSQNRLIKVRSARNQIYREASQIIYQYDPSGNVTCTFQTISDTVLSNTWKFYLEFDESGKLVYETRSRVFIPADSTWGETQEMFFEYNENGKILKMGPEAWFSYTADENLDTLAFLHAIAIGYLNSASLHDSYGNKIIIPELGICSFYYSNLTTSVEEDKVNKEDFTLSQNYPNPFNPVTTITYSLSKSNMVIIKIYDILGKEIATLVNEEKQSGTYNVTWNALDVTSGVYFYKIIIGEHSKTNKMLLLK